LHNDGLVYNYGNSLSANFTGDAKNVIKIPNIKISYMCDAREKTFIGMFYTR